MSVEDKDIVYSIELILLKVAGMEEQIRQLVDEIDKKDRELCDAYASLDKAEGDISSLQDEINELNEKLIESYLLAPQPE